MPVYLSEFRQAPFPRDFSVSQSTNIESGPAATHLPVHLRPTVSKRMQTTIKGRNEAAPVVLTAFSKHSTKGSIRSMGKPNTIPGTDSVRLAMAEEWFNDINRNVSSARNATFLDNDPPFYLRQHSSTTFSSDIDSACAVRSDRSSQSNARPRRPRRVLPTKSMHSRMESGGSTSEDLRSVIDDLTIKNKKLRQKLKIYDRLHCSHLQNDKLFEVRIHALPSHKKREFEQTLRSFASSLEAPSDRPSFIPSPLTTTLLSDPLLSMHKHPSSYTSYSKLVDSTYASQSASGQTMNSHSYRNDVHSSERQVPSADSRTRNVRSYLHDIPRGLLPKKSPFMSEKTKQKMVVRRLERIFTGRCAPSGGNNHSLQQQKVANSAAKSDSQEGKAGGRVFKRGGMREARILSGSIEIPMQSPIYPESCAQSRDNNDGDDFRSRATMPSNDGTPDQRPTRPLDLDLYRAQVPAENMDYIRHLGLASPLADSGTNCDPVDGWVYLNMLTNLAQLHTFNVTPEFVRKSIANVSSRFELSSDGQKVRWKGGTKGTQMGSDSDDSVEPNSDTNDTSDASLNDSSANLGERVKRRPILLDQLKNGTDFQYRPLFCQGSCSENEDDFYMHDEDSLLSFKSANMTRAGSTFKEQIPGAGFVSRSQTKENGPIIFFNKAKFCTDLSGDPNWDMTDHAMHSRYFEEPIGRDQRSGSKDGVHQEVDNLVQGFESKHPGESIYEANVADFDVRLDQMNVSEGKYIYDGVAPIYLEASGLGGVQPQDNFIIEVEMQYQKSVVALPKVPIAHTRVHQILHNVPKSSDALSKVNQIQQREIPQAIEAHVISAVTTALPPSVLPDPSYLCLPLSSDNEDDEDNSTDSSEENVDEKLPRLTLMDDDAIKEENQTPVDFMLGSSGSTSPKTSHASTSNGSDDSSIDLLAHARFLDPDAIAAREREFDFHVEQNYRQASSAETGGDTSWIHSDLSSSSRFSERARLGIKRRRIEVSVDAHHNELI